MRYLAWMIVMWMSGCAGVPQEINEPYTKIKIGTSLVCTAVNPDVIPEAQRQLYIDGCVQALEALQRLDYLLYGADGAPVIEAPPAVDPPEPEAHLDTTQREPTEARFVRRVWRRVAYC